MNNEGWACGRQGIDPIGVQAMARRQNHYQFFQIFELFMVSNLIDFDADYPIRCGMTHPFPGDDLAFSFLLLNKYSLFLPVREEFPKPKPQNEKTSLTEKLTPRLAAPSGLPAAGFVGGIKAVD